MDVRRLSVRILVQISLLCAVASLGLPLQASFAQTAPADISTKLSSVAQAGSRAFSSAQVAALSGLQIGSMVDRTAIQTAADRLARCGLFSTVRFSFATDGSGLNVTFELQDAEAFPISLDNLPWITGDDLTRIVAQAGIPGRTSAPAAGTIDQQIAQSLQATLETKGVHATVSFSVMPVPGSSERVLEFKAAGSDVTLAGLQFSDPLAANDPTVQAQLPNIVGKPFSLTAIERFDFEHVRPVYLSHSYLTVKFPAPVIRFSGSNAVNVTVQVVPGPTFNWSGITWSGNHAYTTADLDALVSGAGLTLGLPVDGNKIAPLWQNIRAAYAHRGYIDATVEPHGTFDETNHHVSYQVSISEGEQYHMGKLVLTGLAMDAERRLRAAWRIPEGQIFDQTYCDYFLSRGIAEALKGLPAASATIGHYLQKNPQQKTVDVMIDFE